LEWRIDIIREISLRKRHNLVGYYTGSLDSASRRIAEIGNCVYEYIFGW